MGNYISIDESKKRNSPLVLVGVIMPTPAKAASRSLDQLIGIGNVLWPSGMHSEKERNLQKVTSMLPMYDFRYITFEANSDMVIKGRRVRLGYNVSMAIALDTLMTACIPLDFAIIDGEMSDVTRDWLDAFLPKNIEFKALPKADEHYPAVNVADSLAYAISSNYRQEIKNRLKFTPSTYSEKIFDFYDERLGKPHQGFSHLR